MIIDEWKRSRRPNDVALRLFHRRLLGQTVQIAQRLFPPVPNSQTNKRTGARKANAQPSKLLRTSKQGLPAFLLDDRGDAVPQPHVRSRAEDDIRKRFCRGGVGLLVVRRRGKVGAGRDLKSTLECWTGPGNTGRSERSRPPGHPKRSKILELVDGGRTGELRPGEGCPRPVGDLDGEEAHHFERDGQHELDRDRLEVPPVGPKGPKTAFLLSSQSTKGLEGVPGVEGRVNDDGCAEDSQGR